MKQHHAIIPFGVSMRLQHNSGGSNMNSTVEKISSNQVKLHMELDAAAFEEALQKAYLKLKGRIAVPGFRKGKAPRALIERMYGENVFYEEAFDQVFPQLYEDTLKELDVNPVSQPDIDIDTIGKGKDLIVNATVYVKPDVTLGEYKGLDVARGDDTVDDDAVEQELSRVQQRNARETDVEDRPVQDDDIVGLDYAGTIDGVPFEGGTAEHQHLTIGSGQFIPGFEEQMVGMKIGEEKDLHVTFPKDYHAEELAGKEAVFHVKVNHIHTRELPELDDEFAKDVSEFDTLDAYKADIRAKLEKEASNRADREFENELVDAAVANASMDVPASMIDTRVDEIMRETALRWAYQGIRMEDYYKYTGQTEEQMRQACRPDAEKYVKGQLVLEAIRKAENLEPSEADIDDVTARYAEQSGKQVEEFKAGLTDAQKEYIREDAATIATLNFLKREAKPSAKAETTGGDE